MSAGGSLEISTDVKPLKGVLKGVLRDYLSLARVGMLLQLPPGFEHVQWFGKGPFECYQDRKVRLWLSSVRWILRLLAPRLCLFYW